MGSSSTVSPEYWGYLIRPDKSPSALFEQLLLGIANYINRQIAPWDVECLTPAKLAAFYRLVGGDYDPLFLETPHSSLSFIYQSLGCFHTLQPEKDPFTAPAVPALTPQGFARWQTVQLLLEPDEHVSFLQNAVKRLEIINPADGTLFPHPLPREALPSRPDPEMLQWHQGVAEKLMIESHPDRVAQISDGHAENSMSSTGDQQSATSSVRYFTHPRPRPTFHPPPAINLPQSIDAPPPRNTRELHPWDLERRRSSTSDLRYPAFVPQLHGNHISTTEPSHDGLNRTRPQSPSTLSTSSTVSSASSSSLTASSASISPRLHSHHHHHQPPHHHRHHGQPRIPPPLRHERRHSSHGPYSPRDAPHAPPRPMAGGYFPPQPPPRPPGSNSRGLNVRWGDTDHTNDSLRGPPEPQGPRRLLMDGELRRGGENERHRQRRSRSGSGGRSTSPLRGVGGRRYAAEGSRR
ncbi:MAG: hypothetical protein Q9222_005319 [Ikaeria aurantiellina]